MQQFLTQVADLRLMLLVQGDQPRSRLIAIHRQRVSEGQQSVLIGLQSFSEGLDLKGELLSQVHIHKISFPPIDSPVIVTEGEWLKRQQRYPFEIQSLPSASFTLIQQVGRLIRSHQCFGEVIIYDRRLLTKSYGSRLLAALPRLALADGEDAGQMLERGLKKTLEELSLVLSSLPRETSVSLLLESNSSLPESQLEEIWRKSWDASQIRQSAIRLEETGLSAVDKWLDDSRNARSLLMIIALQVSPEPPRTVTPSVCNDKTDGEGRAAAQIFTDVIN